MDQENAEHESRIESHRRELRWAARHLIGEKFPLFVLASRGKLGKWLKRLFNIWPEPVYRMDDQAGLPVFALTTIDSGNPKFHLF